MPTAPTTSTDIDLKALYRALYLPRAIEEKMLRLIRQNRISKWFSGYGQEAIAVGCAWALEERDVLLPMHRNLGVWTTRGVPLKSLFCQLMGKAGGYTKGRDRTFHFGLPERRIVGMIATARFASEDRSGLPHSVPRRARRPSVSTVELSNGTACFGCSSLLEPTSSTEGRRRWFTSRRSPVLHGDSAKG